MPSQGWPKRVARRSGSTTSVDRTTAARSTRRCARRIIKLLIRGPGLTGAQIVSAIPKDIGLAPAIRLLQRWGWDLLAERLAGRVRYYPQHQRQLAALARAIDPQRVADWIAALAQTQAVSDHPLNARLAVESALLGYAEAVREQKIGVKATL